MGQYYKPVNLDKKESIYTHDYNSGLKLMEHSYLGNAVMNVVENLLSPVGDWYKCKLVWAGDYAEEEKQRHKNIYNLIEKKITPIESKSFYRYIINHTKKLYIDKDKIKEDEDSTGLKIHPLSLLTCEGNGRGGGDYYKEDIRIGNWSRNVISVENKIPKNYNEINGQFYE